MDILLQDVRYAARKLLRARGFTAIVVATLALAIGATTAVFSIVDGVLLKPLPLRAPERLVALGVVAKNPNELGPISGPDYLDYLARNHSFTGIASFFTGNTNLVVPGAAPVRLATSTVRASFFDVVGVPMARGRGLVAGDDEKGAAHVAVISDRLWRSQFAADSLIVGKSVDIDGTHYTVVGVAPRDLAYPAVSDVWLPLVFEEWMLDPQNRGAHWLEAVARLRPGVTVDAARRDMAAIGDALRGEYRESNATIRPTVLSLDDHVVGGARKALWTMLGAVGLVLLIACANIASLLLIRASARESEMALRIAIGAGRSRIVRQLITESVLLSIAGAVAGSAIAAWVVDFVAAFAPHGLPRVDDIAIDGRALAFTAGLALLTGLVFGLVPALYTSRPELSQMLRDNGRSSSARRSASRARSGLVVVEIGLAVVLLVGAGLLIRSYLKLLAVDPGFRPEHVVTFNVAVPDLRYPLDRDKNRLADAVVDALNALPGSHAAAVGLARPMQAVGMRTSFDIDGRPKAAADARLLTEVRPVSSDYFRVLGIPVARGRLFTKSEERFGPPPAVVVTEAFVKRFFPTEEALGKHITLGITHDTAAKGTAVTSRGEIVGIVPDIKQMRLNETPYPAVYLPHGTFPESDMAFLVRSDADPSALAAMIRRRMAEIDPEMPLFDLETMTEAVSGSVAQPRFYTTLLTGFAGLALLLAALGIYGVISYNVSQRVRELGIRIALGASDQRIVKLVVGQGLTLVGVGIVVGVVGAYALMRLLSTMLFGVQPTDLPTFFLVPLTLAVVAGMASYLPARRASRVDPVIAMRAE